MFRVIYEWRVSTENLASFRRAWSAATDAIHASTQGALGSFMLQSADEPERVMTVAKWRSEGDWQRFWEDSNPEQMLAMRALGERISVQSFYEVDDRTH